MLLPSEYSEKDDQPYCSACHIKLFSKGTVFVMPQPEQWVDPSPKKESNPLAPKIQIDATKCTKCNLNVYKNEEILAAARHWHVACFTCGGTAKAKDGCNRVLTANTYLDHMTDPYCIPCYERLFSDAEKVNEKIRSANEEATGLGHKKTHLTEIEVMKMTYLNVNDAPKCIKCDKVVYKYDEHEAFNKVYHKNCFTCGGASGNGKACQQLLSLQNYGNQDNEPYCYGCLKSLFNISTQLQMDKNGKEITGLREPVVLKENWEAEDPWAHIGIQEGREFWIDTLSEARYGPKTMINEKIDVQGSSTYDKANKFISEVQKLS